MYNAYEVYNPPQRQCPLCRKIILFNALCGCETPQYSYGPTEYYYPEHPRMEGKMDRHGYMELRPVKDTRHMVYRKWVDPVTNMVMGEGHWEDGPTPEDQDD